MRRHLAILLIAAITCASAQQQTGTSVTSGVWVRGKPVPDTTPPVTAITIPTSGASVGGTVSVTAVSSDNVAVTSVQLWIDGSNSGLTSTYGPINSTFSWNATGLTGTHTLQTKAFDGAGNMGVSPVVSVTVGTAAACSMPAGLCAYFGVEIIPTPAPPNFMSAVNGVQNNSTYYDTSFLGHKNLDGTTYSNSAFLSPVTQVTDVLSAAGSTLTSTPSAKYFTAGIGGSAAFPLTSLSLTGGGWIRIDQLTNGRICLFNAPAYLGHCQPASAYTNTGGLNPGSGIFLTQNMCVGGLCPGGGNANKAYNFGQGVFSGTNSNVWLAYGATDSIGGIAGAAAVSPYTFSRAAGSVGIFSFTAPIVDFQYAIPAGANAPEWQNGTTTPQSYTYGQYASHTLTSAEMLNGGAWTTSLTVNLGDIIVSGNCMYKASTPGVTASSGTGPSFLTSGCSNSTYDESKNADGTVIWKGTHSGPSFIYQDVTPGTHTSRGTPFQWLATPATMSTTGSMALNSYTLTVASGTAFAASQVGQTISVSGADSGGATLYTTIRAVNSTTSVTLWEKASTAKSGNATVSLTGHPDIASSTVGDANGIVWEAMGPNYIPQQSSQIWTAIGGASRDTSYPGGSWPRYYSLGISTNTYGTGNQGYKANANQGSGIWATQYDAVTNVYHLLNTISGIWTDWSCVGGAGYNCVGGAWVGTTVGTFAAITDPLGTGQPCPFYLHNEKGSKNGLYVELNNQSTVYSACNSISAYELWKTNTTHDAFNGSASTGSLQLTYAGMNHWDIGTNKLVAFNSSAFALGSCTSPCYKSGVFQTIYDMTGNVSSASNPTFGVSLAQLPSQATAQTTPPGCYVTVGTTAKNPTCDQSEILDFHLSTAADDGSDTYPVCGTAYNDQGGPAFNAWQNMMVCESIYPALPDSALPVTSGHFWQFAHSFCSQTGLTFPLQFCISELSQDGTFLFWTADNNCYSGSTTGAAPTVWTSGSPTYMSMLAIPVVPSDLPSLCGLPWVSLTNYKVGNLVSPIEGLSGTANLDGVFQLIASCVGGVCTTTGGAGTATSGPLSTLASSQPICVVGGVNKSCFAISVAPTASTIGGTVCDSQSGTGNSLNPAIPYSTSCPNGLVWRNLGAQTQLGEVYAVALTH